MCSRFQVDRLSSRLRIIESGKTSARVELPSFADRKWGEI